jgi:hypothetical protein
MSPSHKELSARSLNELVDLLLKLNSKIREKISPRPKEETKGAKNSEMVIIIMNHSSGPPAKAPRPQKTKTLRGEWIEDLCGDIERGSSGQKSH